MLVSELIEETRRLLFGGQREERNKLTADIGPSDTSLAITYPIGQITRGTKLSLDLEDIYVWAASGSTVSPSTAANGEVLPHPIPPGTSLT
jgi:hypothetical protein